MRVTLAYPFTDEKGTSHDPDKTVDLPDESATQLIRDGRAREAESGSKTSSKKQEG